MPRRNALVDEIIQAPGTAATTGRFLEVAFAGGRSARLDLAEPRSVGWLGALGELRAAGLSAYVEIDPESGLITELLVPIAVTIGELTPGDDAVEVELIISQARHHLRRDNPDFDELLTLLEQARADGETVLVTETIDDHSIIDVRPAPKAEITAAETGDPEVAGTPVTYAQVVQMYELAASRVCCSANPTAPGIPFTFPDDGCWGRAHEMARLMIATGITPDKVWIYGGLRVLSANKPDCVVHWRWHVAPTLVAAGTTYVIDPALFPGPVTQANWKAVQGDPNASLVPTGANVFHRRVDGTVTYDPTYSQTNQVLATYRGELQIRSSSADGPPPYPACWPVPPGVQFRGSLAAGASGRWFTYGWPAQWHVFWNVMPTSICPGAPQLRWTVAVERADNANCTYWITVQNLTSRTVRFEGRYNVFST